MSEGNKKVKRAVMKAIAVESLRNGPGISQGKGECADSIFPSSY